jgi:phosphatidate phosphatase PAH1
MAFATPNTGRSYLKYSSAQQPHLHTARLPEKRIKRLQGLIDREEHTRRRDLVKEYIAQRIELSEQRHKSHAPEVRHLIEQTVDHIVDDPTFIFQVGKVFFYA